MRLFRSDMKDIQIDLVLSDYSSFAMPLGHIEENRHFLHQIPAGASKWLGADIKLARPTYLARRHMGLAVSQRL